MGAKVMQHSSLWRSTMKLMGNMEQLLKASFLVLMQENINLGVRACFCFVKTIWSGQAQSLEQKTKSLKIHN